MRFTRLCVLLGLTSSPLTVTTAWAQSEMVYFTVPPCRIADTRLAGGPLAAGSTRDFHVVGTGLATQGGSSSGCGIPTTARAAMVNLTAVNPAGPGDLR